MRTYDDFSFLLLSAPVGGVNENSLINASHHNVNVVNFKNEHTVKAVNKFRRIATASAEERCGFLMICNQGVNFCHIPKGREVVSGDRAASGFMYFRVDLEFPVAVYCLIAPLLQFVADRGFAGTGTAIDQIVSNANWF
jgi:hypothetical protein